MSFEKKSLINNMTATKKAIIASSPASPSVGSKVASKHFAKQAGVITSKKASKGTNVIASKTVAKAAVMSSKTTSKGLK
jgi:hypothetical protein